MTDYPMTIGGIPTPSTQTFSVLNPATGASCGEAPQCSRASLDTAMEAARDAFGEWSSDPEARRAALLASADRLEASASRISPILTMEQGKPLSDAAYEVGLLVSAVRYFAGLTLPTEVLQDDSRARADLIRRPLGVVAAITPWNYPLAIAGQKLGPALAAGNTVVLKPSPYTPLSTLLAGAALAAALPPGVLNVISGSDDLGGWMTTHPTPAMVSFTGSVATGKKVAAAASATLKRTTLELGGNDPAIVLDDVDVERIAKRLFWSAFANSGQVCSAVKRIYAPASHYNDLVEALASLARSVQMGDGTDPGVRLGPINNRPQLERVETLTADALNRGAVAAAGGRRRPGPGYFFEPTVLAVADDSLRVVQEEQFGPAIPVLSYTSVDEAIGRSNATDFGLGASVWATDIDRALDIAPRLQAGTVWINRHLVVENHLPFGGVKSSGIGSENGALGMLEFTSPMTVYLAK